MLMEKMGGWGVDGLVYCDETAIWDTRIELAFIWGLVMIVSGFLLGLPTAFEKYYGVPRQKFEFIGLEWDTKLMIRSLMHDRVQKVQSFFQTVKDEFEKGREVSCRFKSQGTGQLISSVGGCRKARLMAVPLIHDLTDNLRAGRKNYDATFPLTEDWYRVAKWVLAWTRWELCAWMRLGTPLKRMTADASEYGYGGHVMPVEPHGFNFREHFRQNERLLHHNILDVIGAVNVLEAGIQFYDSRGQPGEPYVIAIETDNTMVVKLLSKWACKCRISCERASQLQDFLDLRWIQIRVEFIAGVTMVADRQADITSRAKSKWWERMLVPDLFAQILVQCNADKDQVIDLFSESASRQTELFVSRQFHPHALWEDAMARGWSSDSNMLIGQAWLYAFPPERMIGRIVMQIASGERPVFRLILVVPKLQGKSWYAKLQDLSWQPPILLGKMGVVTVAPEGRKDADKRAIPPNWELIAFFISTVHDGCGV
jgi:hypothetical protein